MSKKYRWQVIAKHGIIWESEDYEFARQAKESAEVCEMYRPVVVRISR